MTERIRPQGYQAIAYDSRTFEGGTLGGWTTWLDTPVVDSTFAFMGSKSCKWTSTANATGILYTGIMVPSGYKYITWSGWCYASRFQDAVYQYFRQHVSVAQPNGNFYQDVMPVSTWQPLWKPFSISQLILPNATGQIDLYIYNTQGLTGDQNWIDDQSLFLHSDPSLFSPIQRI